MELDISPESLTIYKALSSEVRLLILNEIALQPITAIELSNKLHISQSAVSKNIKILLQANLIKTKTGSIKRLYLNVQDINIRFPRTIYPEFQQIKYQIPIGNFFDFKNIQPSCGLISEQNVIQRLDDPITFLSPERIKAQLLYFTSGEIEYKIPLKNDINKKLQMLDISFEAASEFPGSNNNWPSDIELSINDIIVGMFTLPGNPSDVRGKYTPTWWDDHFSQYGKLIQIRIHDQNTGINGLKISDVNLNDLNYQSNDIIKIKFKAVNKYNLSPHGFTLFGRKFGNYNQDILITTYWTKKTTFN